MKKKILLALSLLTGVALAASTYTTHYNLEKPGDGDTTWGSAIRTNFNTIDSTMYSTSQTVDAHITDTVGAHAATAISTSVGPSTCTSSTTVQAYLDCLDTNFGTVTGGDIMTTNTTQSATGAKTWSALQTFNGGVTVGGFSTGLVHSSSGGALSSSSLVNADVDAAAAIAYSKLNLATSIVNADISASAGIVDTKLATISTAGKVSNSATTAVSTNTASAIVARDVSGNFSAGTISAALTGNASTATALAANPTDCGAGTKATAIDASGNLTCSAVSLTADVSGITPIANGGTNSTATATAGGIGYGTGTAHAYTAAGTASDWVLSGGAGTPTLSSTTTTAKTITGSADAIQLTITGNATQTNNILKVQKSDSTALLNVTNTAGTQIRGTTTNDDATAGFVGEAVKAGQSTFTNTPANGVYGDCTSISLTAGDWDISAQWLYRANGATTLQVIGGIGTTSGNSNSGFVDGDNHFDAIGPTANANSSGTVAGYRVSISSTTTYYAKVWASFSAGTPQYTCRISARRVR